MNHFQDYGGFSQPKPSKHKLSRILTLMHHSPQTHQVAKLPPELVVEGIQPSYQIAPLRSVSEGFRRISKSKEKEGMEYNAYVDRSKKSQRGPRSVRPNRFQRKTRKQHHDKFYTNICNSDMTFQECELAILRDAVDRSDKLKGKDMADNEDVRKILRILEDFIIEKKVLLYGGTAINNILPKYAQFYDRTTEIPDYDFYSPDALIHAKELADIYYKKGYIEVEAKSGIHFGTFKVYVNFIPVADITQMHQQLYKTLMKDSIIISKMHYAPPDYLRMSMYLELSRPAGDLSRWEKVLKRLNLLNKYYPLKVKNEGIEDDKIDFHTSITENSSRNDELYIQTRNCFIDQGVVFFGGYASSLYSQYMPEEQRKKLKKYPDYDVLSTEPKECATILKEYLHRNGFKYIKLIEHSEIGEVIPFHIEVKVEGKTIAFIYKPIACHNYNKIHIKDREINIATIDTILTFYLSFWYAGMDYYDKDRLLYMAKYLFDVEQHNRLSQRGLLKRFSIDCYGKQLTLTDLRSEKAEKYKEFVKNRKSKEYEMWFLKYYPNKKREDNRKETKKSVKTPEKEEQSTKTPQEQDELFTKRYIGSPKLSRKKKIKQSNSLLHFITRKNRESEVKSAEPRSGSEIFLDPFSRIGKADSKKDEFLF